MRDYSRKWLKSCDSAWPPLNNRMQRTAIWKDGLFFDAELEGFTQQRWSGLALCARVGRRLRAETALQSVRSLVRDCLEHTGEIRFQIGRRCSSALLRPLWPVAFLFREPRCIARGSSLVSGRQGFAGGIPLQRDRGVRLLLRRCRSGRWQGIVQTFLSCIVTAYVPSCYRCIGCHGKNLKRRPRTLSLCFL